jgi:hypothetical protein
MSVKARIKQLGYGSIMNLGLFQKVKRSKNSVWKVYWKVEQSKLPRPWFAQSSCGRPKMKHQPYMQITLSTKPLGLEEGVKGRNVTCQYVMIRRKKSNAQSKVKAGGMNEGEEMHGAQPQKEAESGEEKDKVDNQAEKDTGEKRKIGSSQASQSDTIRGGKKRKK